MALIDELSDEAAGASRQFAGWRIIVAAWATAILAALVFAGCYALAPVRSLSPDEAALGGAMIPRHDAACSAPLQSGAPELGVCGISSVTADDAASDPDY